MNKLTTAGLNLIEVSEGLRLSAYQDVAGIWTIGYGHTPSYKGQVIDLAHAQFLLKQDLSWAMNDVTLGTHDVSTTDNQFSAMVSLTFNIGGPAFKASSVLLRHRQGNYASAAADFALFDKAHINGRLVVVAGLLKRRQAEAVLYATASSPTMPFA